MPSHPDRVRSEPLPAGYQFGDARMCQPSDHEWGTIGGMYVPAHQFCWICGCVRPLTVATSGHGLSFSYSFRIGADGCTPESIPDREAQRDLKVTEGERHE